MGKLILYGIEVSPPVRTALLTLNALNLDYEFKEVNLMNNEHKSEEFLKKNPQHTVPVLEDDGKCIWDSHAIAAYLVRKYAENDDNLYPKDFYKRAVVDQRLHFDSGVLTSCLKNITAPMWLKQEKTIPQERIDALNEAYNFLETFLEHDFLAGNNLTIADLSVVSSVTSLTAFAEVDPAKTPKLNAWLKRLAELPYYEKANGKGAAIFIQVFKGILGGN